MKRILAIISVLLIASPAIAAQKTKAQLSAEIQALLPTNGQGQITASALRSVVQDMVDSDQQINLINNQTGTSYTVSVDDQGRLLTFNNGSPVSVVLPAAQGTFGTGWNAIFQNLGAGAVTIATSAGTINGAASLVLQQNQIALVTSAGLNSYQVILYSPPIVYAGVTHQYITSITSSGVVSSAQPACADISNAGTVCTQNTGTSGATVPLLNGNNTYSGTSNFTGAFQKSGNTMTFPGSSATIAALDVQNQTVSGGANVTSLSQSTGSIAVNCGARPLQFISNNGAFTITAPSSDGSCVLKVTNAASASAITFSGFSVGANTGDALDTTNGHKFMIFVYRVGGDSTYAVKALQ